LYLSKDISGRKSTVQWRNVLHLWSQGKNRLAGQGSQNFRRTQSQPRSHWIQAIQNRQGSLRILCGLQSQHKGGAQRPDRGTKNEIHLPAHTEWRFQKRWRDRICAMVPAQDKRPGPVRQQDSQLWPRARLWPSRLHRSGQRCIIAITNG